MVCLETDFLVALMRKDQEAVAKLRELAAKGERLATTPINAAELFKGAYRSKSVDENLRKVRGILGRLDILELNLVASEIYGRMTADLESKGEAIGEIDALIASVALAHNERIVTRNVRHFGRVRGLEIEEW